MGRVFARRKSRKHVNAYAVMAVGRSTWAVKPQKEYLAIWMRDCPWDCWRGAMGTLQGQAGSHPGRQSPSSMEIWPVGLGHVFCTDIDREGLRAAAALCVAEGLGGTSQSF